MKYFLECFATPISDISIDTARLIELVNSRGESLKLLFKSQRLCCMIFNPLNLNFQDFPQFFEGTINVWIKEMKPCLATYYPAIESSVDGLALVDELRAAVCKAANLSI